MFALDEVLRRPEEYWATYREKMSPLTTDELLEAGKKWIRPDQQVILVVGNIEEVMAGHPDHEVSFTDFGEITRLPLRDPMTLEPIED